MLACILGENREICFPRLEEAQMMTFDKIATAFLEAHGYQVLLCDSDEEAINKAVELKHGSNLYPVHYSGSNTSGEKAFEEFYTDKETVDIVQMVLAGKVNKTLVNLLQMKGGHAVGLSGIDGGIIEATMKDEALGYVGKITRIRTQPITDLLEKNYIPVISTVASDRQGNTYNINGDTAAAYIAGALNAERLIMMTDIAGILRDKDDPGTLIPALTVKEAKKLFDEGVISGGMIPKVDCCIEAIGKGVRHVVIMDGRVPHSILMELLTDEGAGTMVMGD